MKIYKLEELNIYDKLEDKIVLNGKSYKLLYKTKKESIDDGIKNLKKDIIIDYFGVEYGENDIYIYCLIKDMDAKFDDNYLKKYSIKKEIEEKERKINSATFFNINNKSVILKSFEDKSKFRVMLDIIIVYVIVLLFCLIVFIYFAVDKKMDIEAQKEGVIWISSTIGVIFLVQFTLELIDKDKKKFKIENFEDYLVVNDKLKILHSDIEDVKIKKYVYVFNSVNKEEGVEFKFGLGIGYAGKHHSDIRKILVIKYRCDNKIKKIEFQLKYVNLEKLNEFLGIFI